LPYQKFKTELMLSTKLIGNKIALARKKADISQAQLADQLFISPQAIGKWERGESMPDITTFNRLAEILGVDLNYFSEGFQSTHSEKITSEPDVEHSLAERTEKGNKSHSWDMSRGNWMDADFSGLKNLQQTLASSVVVL
jgi:transcriptional regulator with XRE-family HTH domain